jgi:hypothetical protein
VLIFSKARDWPTSCPDNCVGDYTQAKLRKFIDDQQGEAHPKRTVVIFDDCSISWETEMSRTNPGPARELMTQFRHLNAVVIVVGQLRCMFDHRAAKLARTIFFGPTDDNNERDLYFRDGGGEATDRKQFYKILDQLTPKSTDDKPFLSYTRTHLQMGLESPYSIIRPDKVTFKLHSKSGPKGAGEPEGSDFLDRTSVLGRRR